MTEYVIPFLFARSPDSINKKVYMRFVGTHEEYNKIKDIKNI